MTSQATVIALLIALAVVLIMLIRDYRLRRAFDQASNLIYKQRVQITRLEHSLAHSEAIRKALLEHNFDPILIIDDAQKITACNPASQTLGKCAIGASLIEATRSYELDMLAMDALAGRNGLPRTVTIHNRPYRVHIVLVRDIAIVFLRDISELQRLGRARRDFVANISHELRTPLTALRLLVDSLAPTLDKPTPMQARLIQQMNTQLGALTQLVQELSDLAQIESGQVPMRMVRASMRETAEQVIARLLPQAEQAGLALINNVPEDAYGLFDPAQIQRVLSNLVHNAIKFTPQGSVVVFVCSPDQKRQKLCELAEQDPELARLQPDELLVVGVRDTGVGIPREELPRIFERFYKVDRARGQAGTGLGLSIARHIIEAHGGRIWAESTLGKGTTFYFSVPSEA